MYPVNSADISSFHDLLGGEVLTGDGVHGLKDISLEKIRMCCSFPPNVTGSTFLQQLADDTSGRGGCGLALCSHNCLFPAALFTL